jgi:hypothetical protein
MGSLPNLASGSTARPTLAFRSFKLPRNCTQPSSKGNHMKFAIKTLLLLATLGATLAYAQGPQGTIQHVIIVIQENRTPDNLFHEDAALWNNGNGGHVRPPSDQGPCQGHSPVQLSGAKLAVCFDPDHSHLLPHPSWTNMYDNGLMDGACGNYVECKYCGGTPVSILRDLGARALQLTPRHVLQVVCGRESPRGKYGLRV